MGMEMKMNKKCKHVVYGGSAEQTIRFCYALGSCDKIVDVSCVNIIYSSHFNFNFDVSSGFSPIYILRLVALPTRETQFPRPMYEEWH